VDEAAGVAVEVGTPEDGVSAEVVLDAALLLVPLPARTAPLDYYADDLDDAPSVAACKRLAVKMARLGDGEATLLALQHAAAHVGGYAEGQKGRAA
jgi:hypothetical protein